MNVSKDARRCLVLFKGHPGCGKSSVAEALAQRLLWPLVDKDHFSDALHYFQKSRLETPVPSANDYAYAVTQRTAERILQGGLSCIVVSPLSRKATFLEYKALAAKMSVLLVLVECEASDETEWARRVWQRANNAPAQQQQPRRPPNDTVNNEGRVGDTTPPACGPGCKTLPTHEPTGGPGLQLVGDTSHKPQSWDDVVALIESYHECFKWTADSDVADTLIVHHHVDTTARRGEQYVTVPELVDDVVCSLKLRKLV